MTLFHLHTPTDVVVFLAGLAAMAATAYTVYVLGRYVLVPLLDALLYLPEER
jgi:hypothetical protein